MNQDEADATEARLRHLFLDPLYAPLWQWQTATGKGSEFWWDFRDGAKHVTLKAKGRLVCAAADTVQEAVAAVLAAWEGSQ